MSNMVEVKIDDREIREVLDRMAAKTRDASPFMRDAAAIMKSAVQENFIKEGRPERWKQSKRARKEGGQTLRDTGRLFRSIKEQSTGTSAIVGTNVRYAAIHHFGGKIKHPARERVLHFTQARRGKMTPGGDRFAKAGKAKYGMKVQGKEYTVTMPARPFLHLEPSDLRRILDAAKRFLEP